MTKEELAKLVLRETDTVRHPPEAPHGIVQEYATYMSPEELRSLFDGYQQVILMLDKINEMCHTVIPLANETHTKGSTINHGAWTLAVFAARIQELICELGLEG